VNERREARPGGRRALSHVGGEVELAGGTNEERAALAAALAVGPDEDATRAHVHGFHSYPARLHATTARRLVEALAPRGGTVLDPFCGSGTVLVEARLAGRGAIGVDANPLAVELARLKVRGTDEAQRATLAEAAARVVEHAESRRRARLGATRRYPDEDVATFDPHVLLELDGLRDGIERERDAGLRRVLGLVLSSILVKVSRRPGDTAERTAPRRLASGWTIRLFGAKARELGERLAAFASALPPDAPRARVLLGDARRLDGVDDASVAAAITSPPYAGNYDYLSHHALRLRWLGLDAASFEAAEIGARRKLDVLPFEAAFARWCDDLEATLRALARVLAPGAPAVLVMADTALAGRPLWAADLLRRVAPRAGLAVSCVASQRRPHFHAPTARVFARRPRSEHAALLRAPGR
jgi:SAM-dependent methyltransferase